MAECSTTRSNLRKSNDLSMTSEFVDLNSVDVSVPFLSHDDIVPHEEDTIRVYERTHVF